MVGCDVNCFSPWFQNLAPCSRIPADPKPNSGIQGTLKNLTTLEGENNLEQKRLESYRPYHPDDLRCKSQDLFKRKTENNTHTMTGCTVCHTRKGSISQVVLYCIDNMKTDHKSGHITCGKCAAASHSFGQGVFQRLPNT